MLATFHRELDALHVAVVRFEQVEHAGPSAVGSRHRLFHAERLGPRRVACGFGEVLRGTDAGDHIRSRPIAPYTPIMPDKLISAEAAA